MTGSKGKHMSHNHMATLFVHQHNWTVVLLPKGVYAYALFVVMDQWDQLEKNQSGYMQNASHGIVALDKNMNHGNAPKIKPKPSAGHVQVPCAVFRT